MDGPMSRNEMPNSRPRVSPWTQALRCLTAAAAGFALLAVSCPLARAANAAGTAANEDYPPVQEGPPPRTQTSALPYDAEYAQIGYADSPTHNPIARLQQRLQRGETTLEFNPARGYLDSVLKQLRIDPSSQVLVYSKSSLQVQWVNASRPRAIYFNDDTYAAWVQGVGLLEFATMDSERGPVFYTLINQKDPKVEFNREILRCLVCHDTFALQGGGVPRFLVTSTYADVNGLNLRPSAVREVTDQTPLALRWGGWYVSGQQGRQMHLGNIQVQSARELDALDLARRPNSETLAAWVDTRPYLTDKSDVVALLVFEHQATIDNLITRINFKVRSRVARELQAATPEVAKRNRLNPKTQAWMQELTEPLVQAMLFTKAAPLSDRLASTSGFDQWFQAQGPRDPAGRSLRELDLRTRLFKYPLSYLVYSPAFDALPDYVRAYVFGRFADILTGRDPQDRFAGLSAADRAAVVEILSATKPEFRPFLAARQSAPPGTH